MNLKNYADASDSVWREERAAAAVKEAKMAKSGMVSYWKRMRDYYDGTHDTAKQARGFLSAMELPWIPAGVPDGYLHVESGIEAKIPDFKFSARGEHDDEKASLHEKIVRYVLQNGDINEKNAVNERRLNLYGSAVWKLAVSQNETGEAEIVIENPPLETVFPDPNAASVSECEYVAFVYQMSRTRAERIFEKDLLRASLTVSDIFRAKTAGTKNEFGFGDTVEVTEFWFRQPKSGKEHALIGGEDKQVLTEEVKAGDIALSILIEGREVRYVPKFWSSTSYQEYPFVLYEKIPRDGSLWGKSELEPIIPLIDAADRQLLFAQLNTAYFANDILLYEENAFAPDSFPENRPGAIWKLRPGMMDKVKRLGGLAGDSSVHYEIAEKYRTMMKEAIGNYDFMQGDSSTVVNTATGLSLLGDYASKRMEAKNIGKKAGFEQLYRLIDALALEIFSKEKLYAITDNALALSDISYLPSLDVTVTLGEGLEGTRSFLLAALMEIAQTEITEKNYPVIRAYISALGIPERAALLEEMDKLFMQLPQED